jgi:hypothetical protein
MVDSHPSIRFPAYSALRACTQQYLIAFGVCSALGIFSPRQRIWQFYAPCVQVTKKKSYNFFSDCIERSG